MEQRTLRYKQQKISIREKTILNCDIIEVENYRD